MMKFREIKQSLIDNVLGPNTGGNFRVIGYQKQSQDANENEGLNRSIQVFHQAASFDRGMRINGPQNSEITYRLELVVATKASMDLSPINDSEASEFEKAAAIAAMNESAEIADDSMDEFWENVYQIIMAGDHFDLGLSAGSISGRRIASYQKDQPLSQGDLLVLTASATLSVSATEELVEVGTYPLSSPVSGLVVPDSIDTRIDIGHDEDGSAFDENKAGVLNEVQE